MSTIGECLLSFVEEEWATLWIKITRNNLFSASNGDLGVGGGYDAQEGSNDEEEEKDELEKQRDAH